MGSKVEFELDLYVKVASPTYSVLKDLILKSGNKELIDFFNDAIQRKVIVPHSQILQSSCCEK